MVERLFPVWADAEHVFHKGAAAHPECPERVEAILAALPYEKVEVRLLREPLPDEVRAAVLGKGKTWTMTKDADTYKTAATPLLLERGWHLLDEAVDTLRSGETKRGFVLIRPPGHHAGPFGLPSGFCHQNNIWHCAERFYASGWTKIAILDWDVHHGDGTEAIVAHKGYLFPGVRFCSIHAFGAGVYPGTGAASRSDTVLNLPLPVGCGPRSFLKEFRTEALPYLLEKGTPDVILVSAGYDAHKDDPMGYMRLEDETYTTLSEDLKGVGCPVLFVLEGGYNTAALGRCVAATIAPWL
jgi:acetoin utilization deacetylase AcuC-like enzyme